MKGTVIVEPGWTKYDDNAQKDKILPKLNKGDIVNIDFTAKYAGGSLTTSEESTEVGWFTAEEAFRMITFPLTKKRLANMLSGDRNAHLFCFRRDPFTVVEDSEYPLGMGGK